MNRRLRRLAQKIFIVKISKIKVIGENQGNQQKKRDLNELFI